MPALQNVRNFNLKVIFLVHFVFTALSAMGFWSTTAFTYYNFVLILLLIWSIYHPDNEEPVQLSIVVNGISIILDILLLVLRYPDSDRAGEKFSAAMCILHLIIRPFSIILLVKNLQDRSGNEGLLGSSQNPSSYEDIDRTAGSGSSKIGGGVGSGYDDYRNAQQI